MKIEVKNVSKKFKEVEILRKVNLTFESGNIYGIIGVNGSGKTILLKMLCAFLEPTEGQILFDGVDIIKNNLFPPSTRALIENPSFLPDLTGKENLSLLASLQSKIGEDEIDKSLQNVGLEKEANKLYHKYSLGMKQKLGIAQVLMEDPEVLIFDEPFNGVDDNSIKNIRKLLQKEKKDGKIIITATHIKEDIHKLCDETYQIEDGILKKLSNNK